MAGVTLKNVGKTFGTVRIIEGLDLEIRDHEFMVLVGPSGCGKSTVLRMIAGLEEITAGTIAIGDRVVNDTPPKDRDIAMVFQNYALYPHMSVRENLDFGLRIRKVPRPEVDRLVTEAAEILGIQPLLERKPKELSGGQRQRVAVGRALVRKPAVFLFDEPLSNLDAKLRVQMRAEISKLQQRLNTTTIYVTHDQIEAMTMGHRIAVMKDGFLQQLGTPLEVYETPANLFVAQFIGTPPMNFFRATVRESGTRLEAGSFALPVPARLRPALAGRDGRPVLAGVRPESIHEMEEARQSETAVIQAEVDMVEPLGSQAIVHGRTGEDEFLATFDPRRGPRIGATIGLVVELDRLHLFDPESEKRLSAAA